MALRDQPYFPLYVQDYLTDEKLNECSASTQGIYIKIMCLMHKSEDYGKILLKQKYKQNNNIALSFAKQISKHLPFSIEDLAIAINELLEEKVCYIDEDFLCQKRMINDNELSIKRSLSGKKGGEKTQKNNKNFAKAKDKASSEYENENENININKEQYLKIFDDFRKKYPGKKRGNETEFLNFTKKHKDWKFVLLKLSEKLDNQILERQDKKLKNEFVPEWKNLQTWINQRCWEEETGISGKIKNTEYKGGIL